MIAIGRVGSQGVVLRSGQLARVLVERSNNVRPEKFQFMEKWQNRNFDYKIVITVKNPLLIL